MRNTKKVNSFIKRKFNDSIKIIIILLIILGYVTAYVKIIHFF